MTITKEQLELWMQHPVTQIYFKALDEERSAWLYRIGDGWTIHEDSASGTALDTVKRIGFVQGLNFATTFLEDEAVEEGEDADNELIA